MTSISSQKKLVHSQQEHEKKCFPSIWKWKKTGSQLFRALQTLLQLFGERKKWIPAIWRPKKCSSQLLGAKKKIMTSILKSEKTGSEPVGARKKIFPSYLEVEKNWFLPISSVNKHCCSYLEREKSGSLLFGDQKNVVHNCLEQGKDYDIYLKSEKTGSQPVGAGKNVSQLFGSGKKLVTRYFEPDKTLLQLNRERKKWIPAISRPKNVVHNGQEQGKRL